MIKNYLKIAYRNLWRNKVFTLISSLGLALGISCAVLLFLLIDFHLSFDQFHSKADKIYRINSEEKLPNGNIEYSPGTPLPMAEAIKHDFPELSAVTPIYYTNGMIRVVKPKESDKFQEEHILFAAPDYLKIFDVEWLKGNRNEALNDPNNVVLTETLAEKYFGTGDPLDQLLILENKITLKVTGVIADAPKNNSIPYSMLISYPTNKSYLKLLGLSDVDQANWNSTNSNSQVYILLSEGITKEQIEGHLPEFIKKYKKNPHIDGEKFTLQSLKDIHFDERYSGFSNVFSPAESWSLKLVGVFLVLIASLNFIILSTSQAIKRGKEVGIRKVLGGKRKQLILQFFGETTLIVTLGLLLSLIMVQLILPIYNQFLGLELQLDFSLDGTLIRFLIALLFGISILSGVYPAFLLSLFQPISVLKSNTAGIKLGGLSIRRGLVGFQFVIAQILMISTFVVVLQNRFLSNASLGFNKETVLIVSVPENNKSRHEAFKTRLSQLPEVKSLSLSLKPPASDLTWSTSFVYDTMPKNADFNVQMLFADAQYKDTYGLTLLAGRMFQENDTIRELVVNEMLLQKLGIKDPNDVLGKSLSLGGEYNPKPIVGVIKNFHQSSFRDNINPLIITSRRSEYHLAGIKLENAASLAPALKNIEDNWNAVFPEYLYEYKFLDEEINEFYKGEMRMGQLLAFFSGIAIFIGCIGLYALMAFNINQRLKEIGIRKVLGASAKSISWLISKEFTRIIVFAFVIATPMAAWLMHQWLQNFAYKITLSPFIFLVSLILILIITGLTIGLKSFKAAKLNPVDHLKNE